MSELSEKARRILALCRAEGVDTWIRYKRDSETLAAVAELANASLIETNGQRQMRLKPQAGLLSVVS